MRFMPERINSVLPENLLQHVRRMAGVNEALAALFPRDVESGRLQGAVRDETLVLVCRDRGMATEARFQQREALKAVQAAGWRGLNTVQIRMAKGAAPLDSEAVTRELPREIPEGARTQLETTARTIDDPQLAKALQRLAKAGDPRRKGDPGATQQAE
ncbi:DciA family protein [Thioalkalivibrio sp. ALE16]|uniref:DciA family protein n=1 Tax=Thioalkalivibrio sp. ALE16 TaxID=1158172 RepID=UPI00036BA3A7|nr:DciA family protein [Thioalkalivibrio sp. ALE16]